MHVRADILQAFEDAITPLPIVAAVYDTRAVEGPPRPVKDKVMVELAAIEEGENKPKSGGRPNPDIIERHGRLPIRVTGAVPRDMTGKDFERNVVGPIEVAIATSDAIEALCDDCFIEAIGGDPEHDGGAETFSMIMVWKLTYTTEKTAPGTAL